ncbi:DUF2109 family protein [Methanocaldococcus indicus]|uniref:DUF2109 family protein n=1 Tax=Methanocaldococcus indicus TaxID=213231 RepID=UPI003C6D01FB
MITEILGFVVLLMILRIFLQRSRARKLVYLCCLNFAFAALIALYINSPMGGILSISYFVFSTLSSNAIASTLEKIKDLE